MGLYQIPPSPPSVWRELRGEFEKLHQSQIPEAADVYLNLVSRMMRAARLDDESGEWALQDYNGEDLRSSFLLAAAKAGRALQRTSRRKPSILWLESLYLHLTAIGSAHAHTATTDGLPALVIDNVCLASAIFCSELEREEIEGKPSEMPLHDAVTSAMNRISAQAGKTPPPLPVRHAREPTAEGGTSSKRRAPRTITSPAAIGKVEAYMEKRGLGLTEFATQARITDRTLRAFRKTGKADRATFDLIAKALGLTREQLLSG